MRHHSYFIICPCPLFYCYFTSDLCGDLRLSDDSPCVELLPAMADEMADMDLLDGCQKLFTHFVGVKKRTKMGATAFRTFIR